MKASIIASVATLFTAAIAAPTFSTRQASSTFSLTLTNDMSGATATVPVTVDADPVDIGTLFAGTPIDSMGTIVATSALNASPSGSGIVCLFLDPSTGGTLQLDDQTTYLDLDGNRSVAIQSDVTDFVFGCTAQTA